MTPEEFRTIGHQLIDWVADYRARTDVQRRARPRRPPGRDASAHRVHLSAQPQFGGQSGTAAGFDRANIHTVPYDALDRHTRALVDRVNRSGTAYLTPAVLDGRWMVRVSIGAEPTERAHVEALWATMRLEAGR